MYYLFYISKCLIFTFLQYLVDGKSAKVIERFDCTGCGDTDTKTKVVLSEGSDHIVGLSGRQLKVC